MKSPDTVKKSTCHDSYKATGYVLGLENMGSSFIGHGIDS